MGYEVLYCSGVCHLREVDRPFRLHARLKLVGGERERVEEENARTGNPRAVMRGNVNRCGGEIG